ncbi:MAG: diguanylate cyclase [Pseudomonadota bacterium]
METKLVLIIPFFLASAGTLWVSVKAWSLRRTPGAISLAIGSLCSSWWSCCEGFLYFGFDLDVNIRITQLQYLGLVWVAPWILIFVLNLFSQGDYVRPRRLWALLLLPAITLVLAWTNQRHHLIWSRFLVVHFQGAPMLGLEHGPFFWLFSLYNHLCLGVAAVFLLPKAAAGPSVFRSQARLILLVIATAWAANLVYVAGLSPIRNLDLTPLTFSALSGALAWGFFRRGLLDLAPAAKTQVFNSLVDGVIVLDRLSRIIDLNPAAEKILGRSRDDLVGKTAEEVLPGRPWIEANLRTEVLVNAEEPFRNEDGEEIFDLRIFPIPGRKKEPVGQVMVWRNITAFKQMESELLRLASTDSLTGIYNRRKVMELGEAEFSRSRRYQRRFSVLVLDLDFFKNVNDAHGHQVGDAVLQAFAQTVQTQLRENDLFGRIGGEEFCVLLHETEGVAAFAAAERIRRLVAEHPIPTAAGEIRITVSIGVASLDPADRNLEAVFHKADAALYRAKDQARDRVVSADPAPGEKRER